MTPLETSLIAIVAALFSVVVTVLIRSSRYVTKSDCKARHAEECRLRERQDAELQKQLGDIKKSIGIQFRMLRSITLRLGASTEEMESILNDRPGGPA